MNLIKIIVVATVFLVTAFLIQSIVQPVANEKIVNFLSDEVFPRMPFYSFFKNDIAEGTLKGVIAYAIFVNIPFIPNPPLEPYVIFSISKGTNPILLVLTISVITSIAVSINYLLGYMFGPKLIEKITKKEFKHSKLMSFLSVPITFLTHLLPIPIPAVFPFIFGAYRVNYKFFVLAAFLGVLIKFIIVLLLFEKYGDIFSQLIGRIF